MMLIYVSLCNVYFGYNNFHKGFDYSLRLHLHSLAMYIITSFVIPLLYTTAYTPIRSSSFILLLVSVVLHFILFPESLEIEWLIIHQNEL